MAEEQNSFDQQFGAFAETGGREHAFSRAAAGSSMVQKRRPIQNRTQSEQVGAKPAF